jgi:hypothetical protein
MYKNASLLVPLRNDLRNLLQLASRASEKKNTYARTHWSLLRTV